MRTEPKSGEFVLIDGEPVFDVAWYDEDAGVVVRRVKSGDGPAKFHAIIGRRVTIESSRCPPTNAPVIPPLGTAYPQPAAAGGSTPRRVPVA